jgi:hypothetical protein
MQIAVIQEIAELRVLLAEREAELAEARSKKIEPLCTDRVRRRVCPVLRAS